MAKAALLQGILRRAGVSRKVDTFSVVRIERILGELGITGYEFDFEPRVVRLAEEAHLIKVMLHFMPSGITEDSDIAISKLHDDMALRIGSWQFEARI
ncbi:MAG: hypothetical protein ACYC56_07800 [Candidatus Aquicultor sp.]